MSQNPRFEPAPFQVVSDLGQLRAFNDSFKIHILRILQREEATTEQLVDLVEGSETSVSESVRDLLALRLIRVVGQLETGDSLTDVYRATARIYDLQPDYDDNDMVMAPVAGATLESVKQEVVTSLTHWPNQRMNYESRRRRMSATRAMEFNERLVDLLAEFWGDPGEPVEEDSDEPVMAFAGIWYRFPDKS